MVRKHRPAADPAPAEAAAVPEAPAGEGDATVKEIGGRKDGSDPTRFGDWERNGRCIDF